jgi:hypothetical protein
MALPRDVEACPETIEDRPGAMETHHRTVEANLGHMKDHRVPLGHLVEWSLIIEL